LSLVKFAIGALPNLTELDLSDNGIVDAGLAALASACGSGALPALREIESLAKLYIFFSIS
jgi:Leucine-rich repeat (LRR) protein